MPKKLPGLTTGEIRGQTGIHENTLLRYVKEFPEHFSDEVSKRRMGRRWSVHDINNVLVIRLMKSRHRKHDDIGQALASGTVFAEASPTLNAAMMLDVSARNLQEIIKYRNEIKELTAHARWKDQQYTYIHTLLDRKFAYYDMVIAKVKKDIMTVMFYLKNPLRRYTINNRWQPIIDDIREFIGIKTFVSDKELKAANGKWERARIAYEQNRNEWQDAERQNAVNALPTGRR